MEPFPKPGYSRQINERREIVMRGKKKLEVTSHSCEIEGGIITLTCGVTFELSDGSKFAVEAYTNWTNIEGIKFVALYKEDQILAGAICRSSRYSRSEEEGFFSSDPEITQQKLGEIWEVVTKYANWIYHSRGIDQRDDWLAWRLGGVEGSMYRGWLQEGKMRIFPERPDLLGGAYGVKSFPVEKMEVN
jgi:hypothetical protein